jgi:acetoin utilization deacetylase AcuC-like enzyme
LLPRRARAARPRPRRPRRSRSPIDVLTHRALAQLHPTFGHPEGPERVAVLLDAFPDAGDGAPADRAAIERCHRPEYLEVLAALSEPTWFDYPNTIASETSWEAARLAAGTAIAAGERCGFALVRPPGHHARPQTAFGFCLLNNAAIAARHMQAERGVGRVAIVDWDVHHGNGTQEIFWDDDSVLYVSLHQWPLFPGTGGPRDGNETTINIPLNAGGGDAEYAAAFRDVVEPAVGRFEPDLLLVSAGFDAHEQEDLHLVDMHVSEHGFRELARRCAALAPRVAAVLEGGYNLETLPRLVEAALAGFSSETTTTG